MKPGADRLEQVASRARLRVSQVRTVLWTVAQSRGTAQCLPDSPLRERRVTEHYAGLRFGLPCIARRSRHSIRLRTQSHSLPAQVGESYRCNHTHESGNIHSVWPPNQTASRIKKVSAPPHRPDGRSRSTHSKGMHRITLKLFRPASWRLRRP